MRIAVLTSGGVDSSVSLRLLKDQGHDITAFYLKIWLEEELSYLGNCPWEEDLAFVREVCAQAGVPLEVVPFQKEYWDRVIAATIKEVEAGRTPNPDIFCNARIKFGVFYDYLSLSGSTAKYDKIASGHYAQTEEKDGLTYLKRSPDEVKDQTYFLSQLSQEQVSRALFPIGQCTKEEARKLARQYQLPNALRKDSQGICFLGKIPFERFLEAYLGKRPGKLIEYETGKVLGEHNGFWFYTIGQRRGIRLSGGPWYVVAKNSTTNEIFISHAEKYMEKARDTFEVTGLNWITEKPFAGKEFLVKVRHGAKMYPATIQYKESDRVRVALREKDQGLAAGQFAVFYDGEYCLGGGIIAEEKV